MNVQQIVDQVASGLSGDYDKGPVQWTAGHLDQVRQALLKLGPTQEFRAVCEELLWLALSLEKSLNSAPAAVELGKVIEEVSALAVKMATQEHVETQNERGQGFSEWTGAPAKVDPNEPQVSKKIEGFKLPRNLKG